MTNRSRSYIAVMMFSLILGMGITRANQDVYHHKNIKDAVEKIRNCKYNGGNIFQASAALAFELSKMNPDEKIEDDTLDDIISLLDIPEARFWVAGSLGKLGLCAEKAIPKLLQVLREEDCTCQALRSWGSNAEVIRNALRKIGATAPPFPKCSKE